MYSTYTKTFALCRGSTPATTDCRGFVPPSLKAYYIAPPAGTKPAPQDEKDLSAAWGIPSLNNDDSYRYNQFEKQLAEKVEKAEKKEEKVESKEGYCTLDGKGGCGGSLSSAPIKSCKDGICSIDETNNILPILDPRFNMREAAKHMILLEDHLFQPGRRCKDCCCKHLLTIEAFLDEGITLDKDLKYYDTIIVVSDNFKKFSRGLCQKIQQGNLSDAECCRLAQDLRQIRKPLCQQYATFV